MKFQFQLSPTRNTMDATNQIIRLLIIDDHQMVRDGIRVMLESRANFLQFEIDEAENGETGDSENTEKEF